MKQQGLLTELSITQAGPAFTGLFRIREGNHKGGCLRASTCNARIHQAVVYVAQALLKQFHLGFQTTNLLVTQGEATSFQAIRNAVQASNEHAAAIHETGFLCNEAVRFLSHIDSYI